MACNNGCPFPPLGDLSRRVLYATEIDWQTNKPIITELYERQNLTLREVVKVMREDHKLYATEKMYKTHFRKWGLGKNNRRSEVVAMLCLKSKRDAVGKSSKFIIRGREIDWNDIQRYLKRNPKALAGMNENYSKHTDIICRTPSPDPAAVPSVPAILGASDELRIQEEIARISRDYVDAACEQTWPVVRGYFVGSNGYRSRNDLNRWWNAILSGKRLVMTSHSREGFTVINKALDILPRVIKNQDPGITFRILDVLITLHTGTPEISRQIHAYVKALIPIILGDRHPLALIWTRLGRLDTIDHYEAADVTLRTIIRHFMAASDRSSLTVSSLCHYYINFRQNWPGHDLEDDERFIRKVLDSVPAYRGRVSSRAHARLLFSLCDPLVARNEPTEAETILDHLAPWVLSQDCCATTCRYYRKRGEVAFLKGNLAEGRNWYHMAITHSEQRRGKFHSTTIEILKLLWDEMKKADAEGANEVFLDWMARILESQFYRADDSTLMKRS